MQEAELAGKVRRMSAALTAGTTEEVRWPSTALKATTRSFRGRTEAATRGLGRSTKRRGLRRSTKRQVLGRSSRELGWSTRG